MPKLGHPEYQNNIRLKYNPQNKHWLLYVNIKTYQMIEKTIVEFYMQKISNKFLLSLDFQRLPLVYFLSVQMCMCMLQCACGGRRLSGWRRFSPVSVPRIEFRSSGSAASALTCRAIPPTSKWFLQQLYLRGIYSLHSPLLKINKKEGQMVL